LSALKIAPDEPSVLSNLGLSYMLSKDLPKAEETLRRAYGRADASPRVRQNLAVVVGLQGRLAEAEGIVKADQPAGEAAANTAFLKQLLSRKDGARADADSAKATAGSRPECRLTRFAPRPSALERFQAKWRPVRVKKTCQIRKLEHFSIRLGVS